MWENGAGGETRTPNRPITNRVLYQLSHASSGRNIVNLSWDCKYFFNTVDFFFALGFFFEMLCCDPVNKGSCKNP